MFTVVYWRFQTGCNYRMYKILILAFFLVTAIAACGKKGPLFLPEAKPDLIKTDAEKKSVEFKKNEVKDNQPVSDAKADSEKQKLESTKN